MPKKEPESKARDHLSSALESLRERPHAHVGLESDARIMAVSYVAGVGAESKGVTDRARSGKLRISFNIPEDLCERARNAVWHLSDRIDVNLSSLTERALAVAIAALEQKYNDGKPFPRRKGRLTGRVVRWRSSCGT